MGLKNLRPNDLRAGDLLTPYRGQFTGVPCEVAEVVRGRHSTYRVMVRPLVPVRAEFSMDYTEMVAVERPADA